MKVLQLGSTYSRVLLLLGLVTALLASGCNFSPAPLSREAQIVAYLDGLANIRKDQEATEKAQAETIGPILEQMKVDFGNAAPKAADVFSEAVSGQLKVVQKLQAMNPPQGLETLHKELLADATSMTVEIESAVKALRKSDRDAFITSLKRMDDRFKSVEAKFVSGLNEVGFTSTDDLRRAAEVRRDPMPWAWALFKMFFGGAIAVGIFAWLMGFAMMPALGAFVGGTSMWERRTYIAGAILVGAGVLWVALIASFAGVFFASAAEIMAWPRTQLSGWFVYPLFGLFAFAMYLGDGRDEHSREGSWMLLLLPICCLAGYIWAAAAKGSLVGPWHWLNQVMLSWLG